MRERFDPSMPGDLPNIVRGIYRHIRPDLPGLEAPPAAVVPWEYSRWFGAADYYIRTSGAGPRELAGEVRRLLPPFARAMSWTFNLPVLKTGQITNYTGFGYLMETYQAGTSGTTWCDIGGSLASMNILRSDSPHLEMECTHDPPHVTQYEVDPADDKLCKI